MMKDTFFLLMLAAMFAVLLALGAGIFTMARGKAGQSQKMMRLRVALQGLALFLFVLAFLLRHIHN